MRKDGNCAHVWPLPAECTSAVAKYESGGRVHEVEGHPADIYVQLDVLCDVLLDFKFMGVEPAGGE
tara:strand:+ start:307 stop:504 length:198 start_codon:yes stop_codon:yes gene_type:complete